MCISNRKGIWSLLCNALTKNHSMVKELYFFVYAVQSWARALISRIGCAEVLSSSEFHTSTREILLFARRGNTLRRWNLHTLRTGSLLKLQRRSIKDLAGQSGTLMTTGRSYCWTIDMMRPIRTACQLWRIFPNGLQTIGRWIIIFKSYKKN